MQQKVAKFFDLPRTVSKVLDSVSALSESSYGISRGLDSLVAKIQDIDNTLKEIKAPLSLPYIQTYVNNNPFLASTVDQVNYLHVALMGYPMDVFSQPEHLLNSMSVREIALKILNSHRFRSESKVVVPLWPVDKWVQAELKGLKIWINLHDSFIAMTILEGHYEEEIADVMLRHLPDGGTLVDVGANVGVYTLRGARAVGPTGKVFCFEPRADTFERLQRSIDENGFHDRCVAFHKGLSERAGYAAIYHHDLNPGASYVRESDVAPQQGSIELTALDELDFGRSVEFFKIDVEGFETKVLRGGRDFFRRYRPVATSEVFPAALRSNGASTAEEYISLWEEYGYEVRLFGDGENTRVLTSDDVRDETTVPGLFNIVCYPK